MAQVTIDGKALEFSPGESVIQAATREDIEIPHYCWHPRLSVAANCRMCLVEVEKAPKLVPACQTECKDGMVVHTANDKVRAAQRSVSEFLLVNHPIDCPICDQAGECKLQDYYMKYQLTPSRMREPKVRKKKLQRLGPHVTYDAERCIVCTRCVRFMEEVPKDRQLGVFNRGDHSVIGTAPDQELNNPYALNTVDVCPVGALTSNIFRFKQRVWNLKRSASVCPGCAKGCNVHVDQRAGQVYRLLPRENESVNKSWMCDEGRLTYNRANVGRLTEAFVQGDGGPLATTGAEALARAAALLLPLTKNRSGLAIGLSMHATNETAFVLGQVITQVFGINEVVLLGYGPGEADALLRMADKNPNRAGITQVLQAQGIAVSEAPQLVAQLKAGLRRSLLCIGHEMDAGLAQALADAARRMDVCVHIAFGHSPLTETAQVTLPGTSWVEEEGTWVNGEQRLQRLAPAFAPHPGSRQTLRWLLDLAAALGVDIAHTSMQNLQAQLQAALRSNTAAWSRVDLGAVGPLGATLAPEAPSPAA
jgi:NADH-quinone oxidoreductase subunit G